MVSWGTGPIFIDIAFRKSLKNDLVKILVQINRYRPEMHLAVACDVKESVNCVAYHGFSDVTGKFELDFRVITSRCGFWLFFVDEEKSKAASSPRNGAFKVTCDVTESVVCGKFYGFFDVTSNCELDFRAIGWFVPRCGFQVCLVIFWALSDGHLDKNWSSTPLLRLFSGVSSWITKLRSYLMRFIFIPWTNILGLPKAGVWFYWVGVHSKPYGCIFPLASLIWDRRQ